MFFFIPAQIILINRYEISHFADKITNNSEDLSHANLRYSTLIIFCNFDCGKRNK
jgi:hypothetical protein